jgi:hypothetical protein
MLFLEPDALAARYGFRFEEGYDELDYFERAAIELAEGTQAWLMRHRGNPVPGTIVFVDAAADPAGARALLQQALGLTEVDFRWVAPGATAEQAFA